MEDRRSGADRRSECENHGNLCVLVGETRGIVDQISEKVDNLSEKIDRLAARHADDDSIERWKWKMLKRGGTLAAVIASLVTALYYILKWAAGK